MAIMSNEEVKQLEIYGGITAGAGAIGLAYGYDHYNPEMKQIRKENRIVGRQQRKEKKIADQVAMNERNDAIREQNTLKEVADRRQQREAEEAIMRSKGLDVPQSPTSRRMDRYAGKNIVSKILGKMR